MSKPKPHSAREIRQQREKVLILLSKGFNQTDIASELNVNRNTVLRDIKELNQWTRRGLYDMAKQSLSTMLYSCLIGLNEAEKEAWKLYNNEDTDPSFNSWNKAGAIRLLIEINKSKFKMFSDGPAFMEIGRLQSELGKIKETYFKDNSFRPLVKPASIFDEEHKRNCRMLHIDDNDHTCVNAKGIPYRIEKKDDDSSQELEKENEDSDTEESDPAEDHE